jgi:hypothetical protein
VSTARLFGGPSGRSRVRPGGVFAGERITHAVMGILYGRAALAHLVPEIARWSQGPTGVTPWDAPPSLRLLLPLMADEHAPVLVHEKR